MFASLYFIIIRLIVRKEPFRNALSVLLLFMACLSGFLVEGARLKLTNGGYEISPVGVFFSYLTPNSIIFMKIIVRTHLFIVLAFIAGIPYSVLRHVLLGFFVNIMRRPGEFRESTLSEVDFNSFTKLSGLQILEIASCVECGRCENVCPGFITKKNLSPKRVVKDLMEGVLEKKDKDNLPLITAYNNSDIWACTTCMHCKEICPLKVNPVDKIMQIRRGTYLLEGIKNKQLLAVCRNLEETRDPFGRGISNRIFKNLKSQAWNPELDVVIWPGCFGLHHPRYYYVMELLCLVLERLGKRYRIIEESGCCGMPAKDAGNDLLFREIAFSNKELIARNTSYQLITACPHCQYAFIRYYKELDIEINAVHVSEFIWRELKSKSLFKYPFPITASVHDPCYLFRVLKKGKLGRDVLSKIEGITLREPKRKGLKGLCCGGGGGGMWIKTEGVTVGHLRAKELAEVNPDIIVTSCPYCKIMLEDSLSFIGSNNPYEVKDFIEVISRSMGIILE
ncbi:MAG: (Fe-S)-binding protein [candidate division WOR-3 bacterium]